MVIKMNPDLEQHLRNLLHKSERILWSGQPSLRKSFTGWDAFYIPFSIVFFGFSLFAFRTVFTERPRNFMIILPALVSLLLVYLSFDLCIGRLIYRRYKKKRLCFAVTDKRIVIYYRTGHYEKIEEIGVDHVHALSVKSDSKGIGTIVFNQPKIDDTNRKGLNTLANAKIGIDFGEKIGLSAFYDIADVQNVCSIVERLTNIPPDKIG